MFNGKGIYEVFSGEKEFIFGKQPNKIEDTDTVSQVFLKDPVLNKILLWAEIENNLSV